MEGAYVAFNYRGSTEAAAALVAEVTAAGGRAFAIQADSADSGDVAEMLDQCDAAFGEGPSIDILINNAGVGNAGHDISLKSGSEAQFDEMMRVNMKGPYVVTQQALSRLRNNGRIVNIGSISGKVSQPQNVGYAMGKRALQSLTFSTATAVARRGITCNLIAPGAVATDFITELRATPGFDEGVTKSTPMGRLGQPDDIAGAVLMLCREEARWVTGNIIEASGGLAL